MASNCRNHGDVSVRSYLSSFDTFLSSLTRSNRSGKRSLSSGLGICFRWRITRRDGRLWPDENVINNVKLTTGSRPRLAVTEPPDILETPKGRRERQKEDSRICLGRHSMGSPIRFYGYRSILLAQKIKNKNRKGTTSCAHSVSILDRQGNSFKSGDANFPLSARSSRNSYPRFKETVSRGDATAIARYTVQVDRQVHVSSWTTDGRSARPCSPRTMSMSAST